LSSAAISTSIEPSKHRQKVMKKSDNSDKPAFDGRNRRKKPRRVDKDRRDNMRWELDNPIRRKSPGRRVFDRLLHALHALDKTLKK
jgi:hypothetical protein